VAWIEFHDDVWDHYKTMRLCKLTGLEDTNAVGKLGSLWHFTLRNAWRDANLEPWGDDAIEAACRWRGTPGVFIKALRDVGFLDGSIVHGWLERAGRLVNDRIYNEKRRKTSVKRRKPLATLPNPTVPHPTVPHRINTVSRKMFIKPTAPEVTAYAKSIGFRLDGERFIAHYESNGWKVGRNPLQSWQAAVVTWKKGADAGALIPLPRPFEPIPKPEDRVSHEQVKGLLATIGKGMSK
jgi:hypothetical protein